MTLMVWNVVIWPAARTATAPSGEDALRRRRPELVEGLRAQLMKGGTNRAVLTTATVSPAAIGDALRSTGYLPSEGLSTVVFLATAMNRPLLLEGDPEPARHRSRRRGRPYGCRADPPAVL